MSGLRAHIAGRLRSSSQSLSAVPPRQESPDYSPELAKYAASILFRSPIPSQENRPVYILNAAALPDTKEENFDSLLPYVLARLPEEDELVRGFEYEVVFFAGDSDGSTSSKKNRPGWGWFLQAYHVLSRAMRKRLQKLYIVHEKAWVRILTEVFSTIVSPKFRRKIIHASDLTNLALHIPIEDFLILPSTYLYDRRVSDTIYAPYASGRRAFGARQPLPISSQGTPRLPRVLRETTAFVLAEQNIGAEGLFRVPPHSKLRDVLKEAYDRGQKYIIWKDNGALLQLPPYPHAEHQDDIIAEIDARDAYSAFMAAALIKAWYADLRQPIFPQSCYSELKRLYGNPDDIPDLERLKELFSPASEWSFLPAISREILTKHLLPTLNAVAARGEQNKMTAENLAVCIAPALLHGPDQLEDAKMSSIVRRVFTEAIELWSQGLREACDENEAAFRDSLELPRSPIDWEDPLEQAKGAEEGRAWDEYQSTGIVLQDNEKPAEMPPALPPRVVIASGRAPNDNDNATKRKPAPPLEIPPRYSTLVTDSPIDASPVSYGATTDGFAPRRDEAIPSAHFPDEKKSGTSSGDSYAPQLKLPKRKTLTAEQVDDADNVIAQVHARKASEEMEAHTRALRPSELKGSAMPLPGLANLLIAKAGAGAGAAPPVKRKAVSGAYTASQGSSPTSAISTGSPSTAFPAPFNDFRRPSLPASANRTPQINTLARPVFPTNATPNRPPSKSTSLPVPAPKPRTPSPSLLQRMPSLETSKKEHSLAPPDIPRRLNMKKASVDDLRQLYEERAGTASVLVEAGRKHST